MLAEGLEEEPWVDERFHKISGTTFATHPFNKDCLNCATFEQQTMQTPKAESQKAAGCQPWKFN
jgi:hypothetical protein